MSVFFVIINGSGGGFSLFISLEFMQYYSGNPAAYQDWPDLGTREPLHPRHLGEFKLAVHEDCHALVQLAPEHKDKGSARS